MNRAALLLLVLLPATTTAAPPALTHLYPAGGQQGKTETVTLGGTFERWPVDVWVEGTGVTAKAGKLRITMFAAGSQGAQSS